jgi:hypothetical protein
LTNPTSNGDAGGVIAVIAKWVQNPLSTLKQFVQTGAKVVAILCMVYGVWYFAGGILAIQSEFNSGAPHVLSGVAFLIVGALSIVAVNKERRVLLLPAMVVMVSGFVRTEI